MNASKETCQEAIHHLEEYCEDNELMIENNQRLKIVYSFLQVAEKRLPTESAIARDKKRRKQKAK